MSQPFLSKRLFLFGNVAVLVLCVIFFLVPFAFRGARMSLKGMRNEVADWLPADFDETKELNDFRAHFVGSQFVLMSWDGCQEGDPRFQRMVENLKQNSQQAVLEGDALKARQLGDELGLHISRTEFEDSDPYKEKWTVEGVRWLVGKDDRWFYINKQGELYRWTGESTLLGATMRYIERLRTGTNIATGEKIATLGSPENNEFYNDPRKLTSRLFKDITTGPIVFQTLAGENGSLIRGEYEANSESVFQAEVAAHQRLSGVLFGPTPARGFTWTKSAFEESLPAETIAKMPEGWADYAEEYVANLVETNYGGDKQKLVNAPDDERLLHWLQLFRQLEVPLPPRQTAIVVTLTDEAAMNLSRVVGRPGMVKPMGRIYQLAADSGFAATGLLNQPGSERDWLRLGGPPVDNVAIDEEGTITLFKLISLSTLIGVTLAYISFRSITITAMIFFVGGVSAVMSVAFVWFGGTTLDAILLTMPSLVYVLGLSGSVHIVNYYRETAMEEGKHAAAETAVKHGAVPCFLCAFTTALGLVSLCSSELTPIVKFGWYSAVGVMATLVLTFTYLPAALVTWRPKYDRIDHSGKAQRPEDSLVYRFWDAFGLWIVKNHWLVNTACILIMVVCGFALSRIKTSVQLLKLFDDQAKVIGDYQWLEANLGRLVPMELVLQVDRDFHVESPSKPKTTLSGVDAEELALDRKLSFLERIEIVKRIRKTVESEFGERGLGVIGPGMSSDVFALGEDLEEAGDDLSATRLTYNNRLMESRKELLQTDFLRERADQSELWRISLRLGAFNDVDYGTFVQELKQAVEPVLAAYRTRDSILTKLYEKNGVESRENAKILLVGWHLRTPEEIAEFQKEAKRIQKLPQYERPLAKIDQTAIFCESLKDILQNRGYYFGSKKSDKKAYTIDLADTTQREMISDPTWLEKSISQFDCIIAVGELPAGLSSKALAANVPVIDATKHRFEVDEATRNPLTQTANQMKSVDSPQVVTAVYTGIVPIIYKAQRTLLVSLTNSIVSSFIMISLVMMVLLRDWRSPLLPFNFVNISGGLISMLPNLFPILLIFGIMGYGNWEVDIGSMMTASVALGVAVDDTIHFLTWFRMGMRNGLSRLDAIRGAYAKCATAMTQTTAIAGLGLAAFSFSTFTPTQRFGILMLTLLVAALLGDLIFLPALLASPLGKYLTVKPFRKKKRVEEQIDLAAAGGSEVSLDSNAMSPSRGMRSAMSEDEDGGKTRIDKPHIKGKSSQKSS